MHRVVLFAGDISSELIQTKQLMEVCTRPV